MFLHAGGIDYLLLVLMTHISSGIAALFISFHYRKSSGFSRGASIYRGVTRLVVLKYYSYYICTTVYMITFSFSLERGYRHTFKTVCPEPCTRTHIPPTASALDTVVCGVVF